MSKAGRMTERTNGSRALARDATFSQQTEVALREMILAGEIAPGERINEVALAGELGISRGPLREAIQRLVSGGLLTVISHRGAFVRTFTPGEIVDLYGLRSALELHAVRHGLSTSNGRGAQRPGRPARARPKP